MSMRRLLSLKYGSSLAYHEFSAVYNRKTRSGERVFLCANELFSLCGLLLCGLLRYFLLRYFLFCCHIVKLKILTH